MASDGRRITALVKWFREHGKETFWSLDAGAGLAAFLFTLAAAIAPQVRDAGTTALIAESALQVALAAVIVTALAVFTTFFDSPYRRVLEHASGTVLAAMAPYLAIVVVATIGAASAVISFTIWGAIGDVPQAILLALSTGLTVWTIIGSAQLAWLTAFHANQRAKLQKGVDDARAIRAERLREHNPTN